MAFPCPYCRHIVSLKGAKPGQYQPKCPACARPFRLTIPAEGRPVAEPLPDAPLNPTVAVPKPPAEPPADERTIADPSAPIAPVGADGNRDLTLGGYRIEKLLGRGGMGAVYLARQLSLDRPVALKVMAPRLAQNATFRARFVREAYAAAQLAHHHIVQIYDIGAEGGTVFFSMEYVKGESLGEVLRRRGRLEVAEAVGYVLQAARGLKFAHDLGLVHRDVKPDNLLLNEQGVIKIADLGLVRVQADAVSLDAATDPGTPKHALTAEVTQAQAALGTPAYMAPEQARDATQVDHRADIYSLGCTLYTLLTGRPVFAGQTVLEILSKHATEPITPPDLVVKDVPRELSTLIEKLVAKDPAERFADMGEVTAALELFLNGQTGGAFRPTEEQVNALEASVADFADAPAARVRDWFWPGLFVGFGVLGLALMFVGARWGLAALVVPVEAALAYFVLAGAHRRDHLFVQVRDWAFGGRLIGWLGAGLGLAFVVWLVWLVGGLPHLVTATVLALAIAGMAHFLLDGELAKQRSDALAQGEELLKRLRLRGLPEEGLRQFVCRYGGESWEEYFEALFGYEAKLAARRWWRLVEKGKPRPKFAAWREPILAWVTARLKARRSARQKRTLRQIEEQGLKARGVAEPEAQRWADDLAEALVTEAAEVERAAQAPPRTPTGRPPLKKLVAIRAEELRPRRKERPRPFTPLATAFGPTTRLLLGALLVLACAVWFHQNFPELLPGAAEPASLKALEKPTQPLALPGVPAVLTDWVDSFNGGLAGLLLALTALARGGRVSLLALPGATIAVLGARFGLPELRSCNVDYLPLGIGSLLIVLGAWVLKDRG